jgi:hypothetical protein
LKNISDVETDSYFVADFFNKEGEIIRDGSSEGEEYQTGESREFRIIFTPLEGGMTETRTFEIGSLQRVNNRACLGLE